MRPFDDVTTEDEEPLAALLGTLARATSAESVLEATMDALLACCDDSAAHGPYRRNRMLRATTHLRPDDAYAAVITRSPDGSSAVIADNSWAWSSITIWNHLQRWGLPVALDVQLGQLRALGSDEVRAHLGDAIPVDSQRSLNLMRQRETTHVLALPIWGVGRRLAGMITLEAACRRAVGRAFIWPDCGELLTDLAALAGPYITGLPSKSTREDYTHPLLPVIGSEMARLVRLLRVFAQEDESLLIQGPTGSGKSRLARWCHAVSARHQKPFEVLDLSAIQPDLQRAELFGWRRGAFTGAVRDHRGVVARAEGGTLFIDEIDKLTRPAQASLLQLLEERRYTVLGDDAGARTADVRFIIGTNADLKAEIEAGRFLVDLYYRINILPVRLPPLTRRRDEIAPWAQFMAARRAERSGRQVWLHPDAATLLQEQPWPGNLRQLDSIVRRAVLLALAESDSGVAEIGLEHVDVAVRMDRPASAESGVLTAMQTAAARFVQAAQLLSEQGQSLNLDHVAAFRGAVLSNAVAASGSVEAAFTLLGKETLVASRNHKRALKNALRQLEELKVALAEQ